MANAANIVKTTRIKTHCKSKNKRSTIQYIDMIQKGAIYKTCNRWNVSNISTNGVGSIRSKYQTGTRGPPPKQRAT